MTLSRWKDAGHQDWLKEQQWREDTRLKHEAALDLMSDLDPSKVNQAALYVASLQIFEALRNLGPAGLNDKLGGDSAAFARLINALSRASRETLALQKHSETRAEAQAAVLAIGDPDVTVTDGKRGAILGAV